MKITNLLLAAAVAVSGLTATAANATAINYNFSNASYSGNGDTANITGSFVWDTSSNSVTSSNIGLTGNAGSTPVTCTNCSTNFYNPEHFAINLGPQALYLTFASSLSAGGSVALSLFAPTQGNQPEYQGRSPFTIVSGAAVQAAVPEPATWGLMILGFGMIGAASRSRKVKTTVAYV
ncbi:PEPxxWA-CTERM sorting domain-containing protein [Sphingomonas sp. GB1N7]|uniref:PEPxxWA-CTERM sorting domain-containing protein n=1 Tax=Parasphingomonas caseinilytica TaxID=3096158 RepID=UPI002FC5A928